MPQSQRIGFVLTLSLQDLIVYSESINERLKSAESQFGLENIELTNRLRDTELELQSTHKSRLDLEQKVETLEEVSRSTILQNPNCPKVI